jgi:hypothetical protein
MVTSAQAGDVRDLPLRRLDCNIFISNEVLLSGLNLIGTFSSRCDVHLARDRPSNACPAQPAAAGAG